MYKYSKLKKSELISKEIDKFKDEKEKEKQLLDKMKLTSPFKQRSRKFLTISSPSPVN